MSGGGMMSSLVGQTNFANRSGPTPSYTAPPQAPVYQPTQAAPQVSPLVQQMMMQRQMSQFNPYQQQNMGLPGLLMQMQGQVNQPMMRNQTPVYQNPALGFRPNMQNAQDSLRMVAPSIYKK
jgi:hypothetical protein